MKITIIILACMLLNINQVDARMFSETLKVPKEIQLKDVLAMYDCIPNKENGLFFEIEYKSTTKRKLSETDTGNPSTIIIEKSLGNNYGVTLWFRDHEKKVDKGYIFIFSNEEWRLEDTLTVFHGLG